MPFCNVSRLETICLRRKATLSRQNSYLIWLILVLNAGPPLKSSNDTIPPPPPPTVSILTEEKENTRPTSTPIAAVVNQPIVARQSRSPPRKVVAPVEDPCDAAFEKQYAAQELAMRTARARAVETSTYESRMSCRAQTLRPILRHLLRPRAALVVERWHTQAMMSAQLREHETLLSALDSEWRIILRNETEKAEKEAERAQRREIVQEQVSSRVYFLLWIRLQRICYLARGLWAWRNQATSSMLLSALNEVVPGRPNLQTPAQAPSQPKSTPPTGTRKVGADGIPVVDFSLSCFMSPSPEKEEFPALSHEILRVGLRRELLRWRTHSLRYGMAVWAGHACLRAQQRQTRKSKLELSKLQHDSATLHSASRLKSSIGDAIADDSRAQLTRIAVSSAITSWHSLMKRETGEAKAASLAQRVEEQTAHLEEIERSRASFLSSSMVRTSTLIDSRASENCAASLNLSAEDETAWLELLRKQAEQQLEFTSSRGVVDESVCVGVENLRESIARLEERATKVEENGLREALETARRELASMRSENTALQKALGDVSTRVSVQQREIETLHKAKTENGESAKERLALQSALDDLSTQVTTQCSELSELREEKDLNRREREALETLLRDTIRGAEEREAVTESAMQDALRSMTSLEEEVVRIRHERDELQVLQQELIQGQLEADRMQEEIIHSLQCQIEQAQLTHVPKGHTRHGLWVEVWRRAVMDTAKFYLAAGYTRWRDSVAFQREEEAIFRAAREQASYDTSAKLYSNRKSRAQRDVARAVQRWKRHTIEAATAMTRRSFALYGVWLSNLAYRALVPRGTWRALVEWRLRYLSFRFSQQHGGGTKVVASTHVTPQRSRGMSPSEAFNIGCRGTTESTVQPRTPASGRTPSALDSSVMSVTSRIRALNDGDVADEMRELLKVTGSSQVSREHTSS